MVYRSTQGPTYFYLDDKNARGRAYDWCIDPSKTDCMTAKDYVGCTSCPNGFKLNVAGGETYGTDFATCDPYYDPFDGKPRRQLLGEP